MPGTSERSNTPVVVVVVAIVGLLASVGSAALGGYWANRSVERQLESERSAEIQDQRREVYVDYLRATTQACETYDRTEEPTKIDAVAVEVLNQKARILLIAGSPNLREVVQRFTDGIIDRTACQAEAYFALQEAFLQGAKPDLE